MTDAPPPTAMDHLAELQAVFDTAVDAIISIDASGTVHHFNAAAERMFGWPAADVIGGPVTKIMPASHAANHDDYIKRYQATQEPRIIGIGRKVIGRHRSGREFPLHLSVGSYDGRDKPFYVGIMHDLSREEAERQRLVELQNQLQIMGQHSAVSEMGAALAHELNQPLTAIELFVTAADRLLETDPVKAREMFGRVSEEVQRAGDIIRRIRQMVERGDGERRWHALSALVENAVELCRVSGRDDAIVVHPLPSVEVFADEIQIRQILVNLIKNALDASADTANAQVDVSARVDSHVEIDVKDNGSGVPPEFLAKLFAPFETTKSEGLGIGLSICQGIAEAHGGKLSYLPRPDGKAGSVFRLSLPHHPKESP